MQDDVEQLIKSYLKKIERNVQVIFVVNSKEHAWYNCLRTCPFRSENL